MVLFLIIRPDQEINKTLSVLRAFACPVKFTIVRSAADLTGAVQHFFSINNQQSTIPMAGARGKDFWFFNFQYSIFNPYALQSSIRMSLKALVMITDM
jgi:hypothetical protein